MALLSRGLVGVTPDEMIADYELSPDPGETSCLGGGIPPFGMLCSARWQGWISTATFAWAGQVKLIWLPFASGFWGRRLMYAGSGRPCGSCGGLGTIDEK